MKKINSILFLSFLAGALFGFMQINAQAVEDFKTSSTTQIGKIFPQVNSEGKVRVQISAPEAKWFSSILAL